MIRTSWPRALRCLASPSVRWTLPLGLGTKKLLTIAMRTTLLVPAGSASGTVEFGHVERLRAETSGEIELVGAIPDVGDPGTVVCRDRGTPAGIPGREDLEVGFRSGQGAASDNRPDP